MDIFGSVELVTQLATKLAKAAKVMPRPNSRRVFEEFVAPMKNEWEKIHLDYVGIILAVQKQVRAAALNDERGERFDKTLTAATKLLIKKRERLEPLRDTFRYKVLAHTHVTDIPEYRRFFLSVAEYFIRDKGGGDPDNCVDMMNQTLEWADRDLKGERYGSVSSERFDEISAQYGERTYATPSSTLVQELIAMTKHEPRPTYERLEDSLQTTKINLHEKYAVVLRCYFDAERRLKLL
jgi:hypothetical protein